MGHLAVKSALRVLDFLSLAVRHLTPHENLRAPQLALTKRNKGLLRILKQIVPFNETAQCGSLHSFGHHGGDLFKRLLHDFNTVVSDLSVETHTFQGVDVLHAHIDVELAHTQVLRAEGRTFRLVTT